MPIAGGAGDDDEDRQADVDSNPSCAAFPSDLAQRSLVDRRSEGPGLFARTRPRASPRGAPSPRRSQPCWGLAAGLRVLHPAAGRGRVGAGISPRPRRTPGRSPFTDRDGRRTGARPRHCAARDIPRDSARRQTGSGCGSGSRWAASSGRAHRLQGRCARAWRPDRATVPPKLGPACRDGVDGRTAPPCCPISTMRPRYMTATRSAMCSTTPRSWLMNR